MKKLTFYLILAITTTICNSSCKKTIEPAIINTHDVTEINTTTAICGGIIINDGGGSVNSKGIVWHTSENPSVDYHKGITDEGPGNNEFQSLLAGLLQNTVYFVCAYATNEAGTSYGDKIQFSTAAIPKATFRAKPTTGLAPLTLVFSDESNHEPTFWLWSFGDGNVSDQQNPEHTYHNPGYFNVQLTVSNNYGSDSEIINNLIIATIFDGMGYSCPGTPTLTDVDSNTYRTILIGDQCWMKENLKTTHYSNGIPIEYPSSNFEWERNENGAYSWYDHDLSSKDSYGALYNSYAANNTNGLCPSGWHVPSDEEWAKLVDYVVGQGFTNQQDILNGAGNALRSCLQVDSPIGGDCNTSLHPRWNNDTISSSNHHGFDAFGFSALPGGHRYSNGNFFSLGRGTIFWTANTTFDYIALTRYILHNDGSVGRNAYPRNNGFSVRCIKD